MNLQQTTTFISQLSSIPRVSTNLQADLTYQPSRPFLNPIPTPSSIHLQLKQPGQSPLQLQVSPYDFIYTVKQELAKKLNVDYKTIRLLVKGKGLGDWKCIQDYPNLSDSVIHIMVKTQSNTSTSNGVSCEMDSQAMTNPNSTKSVTTPVASNSANPNDSSSHYKFGQDLSEELSIKCKQEVFWNDLQDTLDKHFTKENAKIVLGKIRSSLIT